MSERPLVLAVVGATGTGKSDLGVRLALDLEGEVVNADAMQLYRGMDIGTAKLTVEQRRGVAHHQLDVLDIRDEASVAGYQQAARAAIADIQARGRHPILVGGSGLYLRAALDRLDIPPTDPLVRATWEEYAHRHGPQAAFAVLADRDPVAAQAIEPGNVRRIVRALEVIELTGRPFSATMPSREFIQPSLMIGLTVPRPALDARLATRVEQMWVAGLLEEVRSLSGLGLRDGRTSSRALGYAQALAELDGAMTTSQAQEATITATRRFVRRQESWFRPDSRIAWLGAQGDPTASALALARAAENVRYD